MRNRCVLIALTLASLLSLCVKPSFGQSDEATSARSAEQMFSTIRDSLGQAADSTLTAVRAADHTPASVRIVPDALTSASARPININRETSRIDPLRQVIQPILAREGIPEELTAVILVESSGNPLALSPKGARGLWQLMPATARRYGLKVDPLNDERIDVEKSTTSAAKYLRDLYARFGSWPLALAAYNTGEQNLQRAIDRAGSRQFATLSYLGYLPAETRAYVPAVLTTMGMSVLPETARSAEPAKPLVYALSTDDALSTVN